MIFVGFFLYTIECSIDEKSFTLRIVFINTYKNNKKEINNNII